MNLYESYFIVTLISVISIFLSRKFKILQDIKSSQTHKHFIKKKSNVSLSGGLILILSIFLLLPQSLILLKIFSFLIFLTGIVSDINFLHSPRIRFIFQTIVIILSIKFLNIYILDIRIDFFNELLKNNNISYLFVLFCVLVLINGTNFIDGVNSSVVGYYILVILSILFLSKIYTLNINQDLFIKLLIVLSVLYLCNIFGIIFLGDSGSYLLSYIVGLSLIDFYNNNPIVSPYYLVCLLWYPAYENLFSIIRKFITKKSPSKADNHHLHHYIYTFISKYIKKTILCNSATGLVICLYNIIFFISIFNSYSFTSTLIIYLLINILIYNILFLFLRKTLINKK